MFRWYVVNTYSGHENKVKHNLEHRVVSLQSAARRPSDRGSDRVRVGDEGQPEDHRREADDARLRARPDGPQRGFLVAGQGHPGGDRLRRCLQRAGPAHPDRGRPPASHQEPAERPAAALSSRSASRSRSSPARCRTSPARSPRSTRTPRSSRCSYRSSAARLRSRSASIRSRSSSYPFAGPACAVPGPSARIRQAPMAKKVLTQIKLQAVGGAGQPGPAGRPRARSARRQHHGVRQGVQRPDPGRCGHGHPGRDHGLRGPLVHVRDQEPSGRRAHQAGAVNLDKGSAEPHVNKVAKITDEHSCGRSPRRR